MLDLKLKLVSINSAWMINFKSFLNKTKYHVHNHTKYLVWRLSTHHLFKILQIVIGKWEITAWDQVSHLCDEYIY